MTASETVAIRAEGLTKRFGPRAAVDGATFEVPRGVVAGFVGPNGAGKTTTMRMLMGLVRRTAGRAEVLGHSIDDPASYVAKVGALIEGPAFYGDLSGRRNLELLATLGRFDRGPMNDVLQTVDLLNRADDPYRTYSLGMKQRLGIASALLRQPELLMLDEPTNGVDPAGIHDMRDLIRQIGSSGTTVFLSSHLLSEIQSICDWLVIVERGRLLYEGPTAGLLDSKTESFLVKTDPLSGLERAVALVQAAGHRVEADGDHVRLFAPSDYIPELARGLQQEDIVLTEIVPVKESLEDRFLQLTGEER
jgi:ABC-2 type transport system ATP-binding protein